MFTIFESFTDMISSNPLIWIFWSNLFLKVQLKVIKREYFVSKKNHLGLPWWVSG